MSVYQTNINTIVSTLYHKGLRHAVICPGSRNAPLIMAFARFSKITCYSVPDERVAGFVALGMSKQLKMPVAVICTSGTAVLNLYPAIAEAFYMQLPLLVITADRPEEMIGRWDGQTIQQYEVFKPHILGSFQTPETLDKDEIKNIQKITLDFYQRSMSDIQGPVHLNVPLKEPLYDAGKLEFQYPDIKIENEQFNEESTRVTHKTFFESISGKKIMILIGADYPDGAHTGLEKISTNGSAVVIADVISNAHAIQNISNWEAVLLNTSPQQKSDLLPDILITAGKMVLNKTIKQWLRAHPPQHHIHVAENGFTADTFFTKPEILSISPDVFFEELSMFLPEAEVTYVSAFKVLAGQQWLKSEPLLEQNFNEFYAIGQILKQLPEQLVLHLANSMSVRYVAYLAAYLKPDWKIYANRGVSGIDGCSSTAMGMAMLDNKLNVLITGDIAFYYDINALWQRQLPKNMRIIMMNNFGGGIFKNIDGPSGLPELDPYMETPHQLKANHLAAHFGSRYFLVSDEKQLEETLPLFLDGPGMAIMEITTDSNINSNIFKQYKSIIL